MPMPNTLPVPDWAKVFTDAHDYASWRSIGKKPEHQTRMDEIYAGTPISAENTDWLQGLDRPVRVIVVAEDWCPDVVRHVPVLQKLADLAPAIDVKYTTRRENPDVLVRFLTNGTESVPKFGFFNEDFVQCVKWGPMQHDCRELIQRGRACGDLRAARVKVSALYKADPNLEVVVRELMHCFDIASSREA